AASPAVCDNLVFHRRAALDRLGERLLDSNRTIGQPDKLTTIFGHKVTKSYRGKLQTEIENMHLPNPVIRSHYRNGFIKQYVRDHLILAPRPPPTTSPTTASAKRWTTCRRYARRSRPSTITTSTSSKISLKAS